MADVSDLEMMMLEDFGFISRDIYAFYPLLIRFIDRNKTQWITNRDQSAEDLFWKCADIFLHWAQSIVSIVKIRLVGTGSTRWHGNKAHLL